MTTLSNAIGPFCSAWLGCTCCKIALLILTSGFSLNPHFHHLHRWRATKGRDNANDQTTFENCMIPGHWWQCAIPNSGVHHRDDRQHHHHLLHFWIRRQTLGLSKQDEVKNWKQIQNIKGISPLSTWKTWLLRPFSGQKRDFQVSEGVDEPDRSSCHLPLLHLPHPRGGRFHFHGYDRSQNHQHIQITLWRWHITLDHKKQQSTQISLLWS